MAVVDIEEAIGGKLHDLASSRAPLVQRSIKLVIDLELTLHFRIYDCHTDVATSATIGTGTSRVITPLTSSCVGEREPKREAKDRTPPTKYKLRITVMIRSFRYGRERIRSPFVKP
jgi:hypothetical protein